MNIFNRIKPLFLDKKNSVMFLLIIALFCQIMLYITTNKSNNSSQVQLIVTEANNAYQAGLYEKSANLYESLLKNSIINSSLLYNLGNAYYRLNNTPKAIAYYKSAASYSPRDADIAVNLDFARKKNIDVIEEKTDYSHMLFFWVFWANKKEWLMISAISLTLLTLNLCLQKFSIVSFSLSWLTWILSLIATIATLTFVLKITDLLTTPEGVILSKEVFVKSANNSNSVTLFTAHENTEVYIDDKRENWLQIRLHDGKRGWVLNSEIQPIFQN